MEGKGISKHKYRLYALRLVVLVPSLVLSYELIFLPGSIKTDVSSKSQALDRPVDEREKKKKIHLRTAAWYIHCKLQGHVMMNNEHVQCSFSS